MRRVLATTSARECGRDATEIVLRHIPLGTEQAEAERLETQRLAEENATERLRLATSSLALALNRLAAGDLAFQIDQPFAAEFEPLRHDFNSAIQCVRDAIAAAPVSPA